MKNPSISDMPFPKDCIIVNIRQDKNERHSVIYAELRSVEGELLIAASIDYIVNRLRERGIEK